MAEKGRVGVRKHGLFRTSKFDVTLGCETYGFVLGRISNLEGLKSLRLTKVGMADEMTVKRKGAASHPLPC